MYTNRRTESAKEQLAGSVSRWRSGTISANDSDIHLSPMYVHRAVICCLAGLIDVLVTVWWDESSRVLLRLILVLHECSNSNQMWMAMSIDCDLQSRGNRTHIRDDDDNNSNDSAEQKWKCVISSQGAHRFCCFCSGC